MPAPPHPSRWAPAGPRPRDLRQAEKLPQSLEGAVQGRSDIRQTLYARPSPGLPCHVLSSPHPSPGQLLVGRRLRTGGPLGFPGAGRAEGVGHISAPLFSGLFLVLGQVLRDPTLIYSSQRDICDPMWAPGQAGVEVLWGGGAMPGWRVRGFSTRWGGCPGQQRPEPGVLAAGLLNGGRPRPSVPLRARQTGRWVACP